MKEATIRICPGCHQNFVGTALYCSVSCRSYDWRKRQRAAPSPLRASQFAPGAAIRGVPTVQTDRYSKHMIDVAASNLGLARDVFDGTGSKLHLLASLAAEIEIRLPETVAIARRNGLTWEEINAISGIGRDRARRLVAIHAAAEARHAEWLAASEATVAQRLAELRAELLGETGENAPDAKGGTNTDLLAASPDDHLE